jgi:hypothetical protein
MQCRNGLVQLSPSLLNSTSNVQCAAQFAAQCLQRIVFVLKGDLLYVTCILVLEQGTSACSVEVGE